MEKEVVEMLRHLQNWFLIHQVSHKVTYIVGFLLFMALLSVLISKRLKVPIVVGYVFLGVLFSVNVIEWIPFLSLEQKEWYTFTVESFDYIAHFALAFIAFTIGSELSIRVLKNLGKSIVYIVLLQAFGAFLLVLLAILVLGKPLYLALLLGAIASATAPAATVMVLNEYNAKGMVTSMILAVVGIDDAIALIIFSLIEPIALNQYLGEEKLLIGEVLIVPLLEIVASLVMGIVIGYISQKFIVKFTDGTKKILTLVVTVIGSSALAILFNLSPLITNMAVGFAYRNFARKNLNIAQYIDILTTPLYALFFILAGTEIRLDSITSISFLLIAFVYTITRVIGKVGGSFIGGVLADAPDKVKKYVGLGLLPQSGVAIALAYTVEQDFSFAPEVGLLIFNILLFTSALTEVFGPLATKYAVSKAGEVKLEQDDRLSS